MFLKLTFYGTVMLKFIRKRDKTKQGYFEELYGEKNFPYQIRRYILKLSWLRQQNIREANGLQEDPERTYVIRLHKN